MHCHASNIDRSNPSTSSSSDQCHWYRSIALFWSMSWFPSHSIRFRGSKPRPSFQLLLPISHGSVTVKAGLLHLLNGSFVVWDNRCQSSPSRGDFQPFPASYVSWIVRGLHHPSCLCLFLSPQPCGWPVSRICWFFLRTASLMSDAPKALGFNPEFASSFLRPVTQSSFFPTSDKAILTTDTLKLERNEQKRTWISDRTHITKHNSTSRTGHISHPSQVSPETRHALQL
ncbi:hypothetical protein BDW62DRAFT_111791 [Aspergillus aurantiobrunneus]